MGASNFARSNASSYFVVAGTEKYYECSECEEATYEPDHQECDCKDGEMERPWETFQWEDFKENAISYIEEQIILKNKDNYVCSHKPKDDNDRNYWGQGLTAVGRGFSYSNKMFGGYDFEIEVEISAILRSAYYEGANFDWTCEFKLPNTHDIELEYLYETAKEDLIYYENFPPSKAIQYAKMIEKKGRKLLDELTSNLEECFKHLADGEYGVSAKFSNGETWYSKVA